MTKLSRDVQRLVERRGLMRARDGAIIDPVVDETTGVQWFFKFRKNSPLKHKWIFMGGCDLVAFDGTNFTPVNTALNVPGTPQVVVPFFGIYLPGMQSGVVGVAALTGVTLGLTIDGTTTFFSQGLTMPAGTPSMSIKSDYPVDGQELKAGVTVQQTYQNSSSSGATYLSRMVSLRPRRIMI